MIDLHIHLDDRDNLARTIYTQLREAILAGRLRRGDRVPPTRELARRLDVSRNTVGLAYEWLVAEGLLAGRKGAGTFVDAGVLARAEKPRVGSAIRHRKVWDGIAAPATRERAPRFDFGVGTPDARLFPFDAWRRLVARQIRATRLTADYGDAGGHPRLRAAIARYV